MMKHWSKLLHIKNIYAYEELRDRNISASMSNTHKHLVNCVKAIRASFILISFIFLLLSKFPTLIILFYCLQLYVNSSKRAFLPNFASKLLNSTGKKLSNFHSPCAVIIAIHLIIQYFQLEMSHH